MMHCLAKSMERNYGRLDYVRFVCAKTCRDHGRIRHRAA